MTNPPDLFARVAEAAAKHGLPVLVIGGHAVNAYGYVRTTLDADFLVCDEDFAAWRQVFESLGYRWNGQTEAFAKLDAPETDPPSLPVDIMLVNRQTFTKLVAGQRRLAFGSSFLDVPQPLHLIALKLHAMRNAERMRRGKDLPDILQLIEICHIDATSAEFNAILQRYANAETQRLLHAHLQNR